MDVSASDQTMYVAALGNNSLAVVDLGEGRFVWSVAGLRSPQGVVFVRPLNQIFVTNAGDGSVDVFDARSLGRLGTIQLSSDADNIRYDASSQLLYVGYGNGAIASINASSGKVVGTVSLAGHPESFQLESHGSRIFVNVPQARHAAVVDRRMGSVVASWPLPNGTSGNFPMALDEGNHRLFVGTRDPPSLLVLDSDSGKLVAKMAVSQDPDDISYSANGCLYISAGAGFVDLIRQVDADHYSLVSAIATVQGARTSFFESDLHRFYLAAPAIGGPAMVYVYSTGSG